MSEHFNRRRILTSLLWKFLEMGGTQGIQFLISIILARLLSPTDYGMVAIVTAFITIASVFVQSGLNTALIQKKNVDDLDYSSVFYLSLLIAIVLNIFLFAIAPVIASFFSMPQIVWVIRVLSINLIFGAMNSVPHAIIARNLQFKLLFYRSAIALSISGALGIVMAYQGYGVWALVAQSLIGQVTVTIVLWFTLRWRPRLICSIERLKTLFSFAWKLLISSLIDTAYSEIRSLVVGKKFTPELLGIYDKGQKFPSLIVTNVNGSVQAVMFPVLASQQDDRNRAKNIMRRSIITSSFVVFPLMMGLAVTAEPMVRVILTDKWLPSVPFIQIACFVYGLMPIHTANLQAINALGRSDIFLKLEVIKKILGVLILVISVFWGIYAIAIGGFVSGILGSFINAYPNKQLLDYSYKEQIIDILPSYLLSILMGVIVFPLKWLDLPTVLILVLQVAVGAIVYISLAKVFKMESYTYLMNLIKTYFAEKRTHTTTMRN